MYMCMVPLCVLMTVCVPLAAPRCVCLIASGYVRVHVCPSAGWLSSRISQWVDQWG